MQQVNNYWHLEPGRYISVMSTTWNHASIRSVWANGPR